MYPSILAIFGLPGGMEWIVIGVLALLIFGRRAARKRAVRHPSCRNVADETLWEGSSTARGFIPCGPTEAHCRPGRRRSGGGGLCRRRERHPGGIVTPRFRRSGRGLPW